MAMLPPITDIPVAEALAAQPAAGKKVYWLEGNIQSILPITGAAVVLICILSSLLSIRRVIVLEPAVVFRG